MSSGDAPTIVQCNLGTFDSFRCSPLRMVADPKNVVQRYVLSIRPRYGAVTAAGEGHALCWTSLTQVIRLRQE